ncbi:hypothetical protein GCM10017714_16110 [Curtobacterium pusillum]|uniref:hypothetical protein n=1 Tax=Curtobacterium pusillum TaxID=69373 RepID=UPI0031E0E5E5
MPEAATEDEALVDDLAARAAAATRAAAAAPAAAAARAAAAAPAAAQAADAGLAPSARRLVVLIDGRSGTGKTTLGNALAARLGAQIVHLDDVYRGGTDCERRRKPW